MYWVIPIKYDGISFLIVCFRFSLRPLLLGKKARGLKSRMTALSWALLAINVPFKRALSLPPPPPSGSGIAVPAAATMGPSLRHEVCHQLLKERFLSGTSYVDTQLPAEGLGRALKALRVLVDNEDDLLKVCWPVGWSLVVRCRTICTPCLCFRRCHLSEADQNYTPNIDLFFAPPTAVFIRTRESPAIGVNTSLWLSPTRWQRGPWWCPKPASLRRRRARKWSTYWRPSTRSSPTSCRVPCRW